MNSKRRIFFAVIMFFMVFLIGVAGFKVLGGQEWSWLDSLYMTVITLSTVGYGEIVDISSNVPARIFVVVFIVLCLGTIAFAVSSITSFIVEGELKNILGRRKMEKRISRLKDHYIVCGFEETALTIIKELLLTKRDFVVVEPSQERIDKLLTLGDIIFLQGDPAEDDVLISAGIKGARGILLSLPNDEANLFVSITARSLNPEIRIVTKGIDVKSHGKMKKAGSDAVVSPSFIGGMRMVSEMIRPSVVTFLDMMLRDRDRVLRFEEVQVKPDSFLVGKKLCESRVKEKTGALIVAIRKAGTGEYDFNPAREAEIQADDTLILIAAPEMLQDLEKLTSGD
jgi:voltage-gated potassium channel